MSMASIEDCILILFWCKNICDNGDWSCGPCYNWMTCTHPKGCGNALEPKPCLTELTVEEIKEGIDKMFERWPGKKANKSLNTKYATAYTPERG